MKPQKTNSIESTVLRKKAVEALKKGMSTIDIDEVDIVKLIHELQVHQIELEMQNEELKNAKEKAESAYEKYVDLYDFAPMGYFNLSEEGIILNLNFSGANMLAKDRIHLKNARFRHYVSPDSLKIFDQLLEKVFKQHDKETCEIMIKSENEEPTYVQIDAIVPQNTRQCLLTLIDITQRKKMETELQKLSK